MQQSAPGECEEDAAALAVTTQSSLSRPRIARSEDLRQYLCSGDCLRAAVDRHYHVRPLARVCPLHSRGSGCSPGRRRVTSDSQGRSSSLHVLGWLCDQEAHGCEPFRRMRASTQLCSSSNDSRVLSQNFHSAFVKRLPTYSLSQTYTPKSAKRSPPVRQYLITARTVTGAQSPYSL